ncbi:hypothetical protein MSAN_02167800 [Mycena sanguinolenta]|uniref:Uncharacterized protein n=1 Tax=Mycena sanguinolenta TaxID=230812 RepID=A0A8H6XEA9_9AGAR|nr:hypothetical protein MSAN_02167800 [Mycena sanguinolenta]
MKNLFAECTPRSLKATACPVDALGSTPSGANGNSPPSTPSQNAVRISSTIERANSRKILYKNLIRLLSSPHTASLPVLMDYHEMHHGLRSVDSYNLLISLAIRHVAYGTVQFLLNCMAADKIPGNLETEKLKTRWFVRSGHWEDAWREVTATHSQPIPLSLWLEFFHGTKSTGVPPARVHVPAIRSPEARFRTLMQNLPAFLPNEVEDSVRAVHIVVHAMLSRNRPESALTLATRYFNDLPRHINTRWARKCIAVIDALIAFEGQKRGLLDFFAARRKLNSLLAIHPSLRPTSKTLYLLLGTLRKAKRCGSVSWQTLARFKTRWGPQVEDRRVRRRVASYAVIERRLDIFDKVFDAERRSRTMGRQAGPTEQLTSSMRRPFREMFPRHGYEERLWKSLSMRALKVKFQLQHTQS